MKYLDEMAEKVNNFESGVTNPLALMIIKFQVQERKNQALQQRIQEFHAENQALRNENRELKWKLMQTGGNGGNVEPEEGVSGDVKVKKIENK